MICDLNMPPTDTSTYVLSVLCLALLLIINSQCSLGSKSKGLSALTKLSIWHFPNQGNRVEVFLCIVHEDTHTWWSPLFHPAFGFFFLFWREQKTKHMGKHQQEPQQKKKTPWVFKSRLKLHLELIKIIKFSIFKHKFLVVYFVVWMLHFST